MSMEYRSLSQPIRRNCRRRTMVSIVILAAAVVGGLALPAEARTEEEVKALAERAVAHDRHGAIFMGIYVHLIVRFMRLYLETLIKSLRNAKIKISRDAHWVFVDP